MILILFRATNTPVSMAVEGDGVRLEEELAVTGAEELRDLVRERRQSLGLTQAALAAQVGMSPEWVTKVEAGRFVPRLQALRRLAAALEVPYEDLLLASGHTGERLEAERVARVVPERIMDRRLREVVAAWPDLSPPVHDLLVRMVRLFQSDGRTAEVQAAEE